MDEDRLRGSATGLGGKAKDAPGGLVGDSRTQAEGKADQLTGQLRTAYGSARDGAREVADGMASQVGTYAKEQPVAALLAAVGVGYVLSFLVHRR